METSTTNLSREERFKKAQALREKAQKEKANGDFGTVDVPKFKTLALNPNHSHVIRILGESMECHEKPTDMIMIEKSLICDDDGKWFNVIWSNDTEHPMNKLRKTILGKYKYDKETKTKTYDNRDLEVFKIWQTNRQFEKASTFSNGMNPTKYILMNVIDRDDNWCKENKHSKVLCWSSKSEEKDGKIVEYPEMGVKPSLYNTIWDEKCSTAMIHFNDTDFVVRRLDSKTKIGDNTYIQICLPEEKSTITAMERKDDCEYISHIVEGDLTEEEKSYAMYEFENIPFISAPTPCGVILKHLGKLIKKADETFGTKLYDEFVEWKTKENEEFQKNKTTVKENTTPTEVEESSAENEVEESNDLPTEVEEPKTETSKVVKKVSKPTFDVSKYFNDFPALEKLSDEERSLIVGFNEDEGTFVYKSGIELAECPECGATIPDAWTKCICGIEFA